MSSRPASPDYQPAERAADNKQKYKCRSVRLSEKAVRDCHVCLNVIASMKGSISYFFQNSSSFMCAAHGGAFRRAGLPICPRLFLHAREALAVRRRPRPDVRRFRRRVVLADTARLRTDEVQVLAVLLTWLALPKHVPPLSKPGRNRRAASRSRGLSGWLRVQRGM
jgi:hypothetical protein